MNPEDDTRNLIDRYKGKSNEEIVTDLDKKRTPIEIAIENLSHDFNIGTIIRNANAFNIRAVHIIGKRKYNRRGAMVTDKYLHMNHFHDVEDFVTDAHFGLGAVDVNHIAHLEVGRLLPVHKIAVFQQELGKVELVAVRRYYPIAHFSKFYNG